MAEQQQAPSATDIEYLQGHPELAQKFDAKFGEGTSASYFPEPETPEQTEVVPEGVMGYAADIGTLHQSMEKVINSKRYDLGREKVPDGITSPAESHRVDLLSWEISDYKQTAREELMDQYPELEQAWEKYMKYRDNAEAGKAVEGERENLLLKF